MSHSLGKNISTRDSSQAAHHYNSRKMPMKPYHFDRACLVRNVTTEPFARNLLDLRIRRRKWRFGNRFKTNIIKLNQNIISRNQGSNPRFKKMLYLVRKHPSDWTSWTEDDIFKPALSLRLFTFMVISERFLDEFYSLQNQNGGSLLRRLTR